MLEFGAVMFVVWLITRDEMLKRKIEDLRTEVEALQTDVTDLRTELNALNPDDESDYP